jgi:hypothetical protein
MSGTKATPANVKLEICAAPQEARQILADSAGVHASHASHEARIVRVHNVQAAVSVLAVNGVHTDDDKTKPAASLVRVPNGMRIVKNALAIKADAVVSESLVTSTTTYPNCNGNGQCGTSSESDTSDTETNGAPNAKRARVDSTTPMKTSPPTKSPSKKCSAPKKSAAVTPTPPVDQILCSGDVAVGELQPASTSMPPPTQLPTNKLRCACEWGMCTKVFSRPGQLQFHAAEDHVHATDTAQLCQWPNCDAIPRSKWSLITHLQVRVIRLLTHTILQISGTTH